MAKKKTTRRVPTDAQLAKIEKSKDLPMVRVTWIDACHHRGWGDIHQKFPFDEPAIREGIAAGEREIS